MLMMRLQRIGRKNDPAYRVVVVDKRTGPKSNKYVDLVGNYQPKTGNIQLDAEKIQGWLKNGVQASDTVHNMLVSADIVKGKKRNSLPKKSPIIDEEKLKAEAEAKEAAEAAAKEAAETKEVEEVAEEEAAGEADAEAGEAAEEIVDETKETPAAAAEDAA